MFRVRPLSPSSEPFILFPELDELVCEIETENLKTEAFKLQIVWRGRQFKPLKLKRVDEEEEISFSFSMTKMPLPALISL